MLLSIAKNNLYVVFARYPKPVSARLELIDWDIIAYEGLEGLRRMEEGNEIFCVFDESLLADIPCAYMQELNFLGVGRAQEAKYYLPRVLDCFADNIHMRTNIFAYIGENCHEWPENEKLALEKYVSALFPHYINDSQDVTPLIEVLLAVPFDLDSYLQIWDKVESSLKEQQIIKILRSADFNLGMPGVFSVINWGYANHGALMKLMNWLLCDKHLMEFGFFQNDEWEFILTRKLVAFEMAGKR